MNRIPPLSRRAIAAAAFLVLACAAHVRGATWNNTTSGYWTNDANWTGGVPGNGADVVIPTGAGTVILDRATSTLKTYTQQAGTLEFRGWESCLAAGMVMLASGAVTHAACDTNAAPGNTNRVWMVTTDLTVAAAARIDADYKGFPKLQGPGGGLGNYGSGSYGGKGGSAHPSSVTGPTYGSATEPLEPGSGGKESAGGGAVRIEAAGRVTVDGSVSCRGQTAGNYAGAGSGGSLCIACRTFNGAGGLLDASGGDSGSNDGEGGGGGRIAVTYDAAAQSSSGLTPTVEMRAGGGRGTRSGTYFGEGQEGTLYLTDASVLPATWQGGARITFASPAPAPSLPYLRLVRGRLSFDNSVALSVATDLDLRTLPRTNNWDYGSNGLTFFQRSAITVGGSIAASNAYLKLYSASDIPTTLTCAGHLLLHSNGTLYTYSGSTNATHSDYGCLVHVAGDMTLERGAWVYPALLNPTNLLNDGGAALLKVRNLTVQGTNAGFNATGLGYRQGLTGVHDDGYGPGWGDASYGGGSYGGAGGWKASWSTAGGGVYGSSNAPVQSGSGADKSGVGGGGGCVRIEAAQSVTLDGRIEADGAGLTGTYGSGSSGGGIYIRCSTFAGSGILSAKGGRGGNNDGCGGGGGRIAVWRATDRFTGAALVDGGAGGTGDPAGQPGTIVWGIFVGPKPSGMLMTIR